MRLEYIDKFSYVLEYKDHAFVFDYAQGHLPARYLKNCKNTVFLISSFEKDHFDESVFSYKKQMIVNQNMISLTDEEFYVMKSGDVLHLGLVKIVAVGHPKLGMGYLLITEDFQLFHTGSLRSQHHRDDLSLIDRLQYQEIFDTLILALKRVSKLDFLIAEVNPFLSEDYDKDAQSLLRVLNPKRFFPSNYSHKAENINRFLTYIKEHSSSEVFLANHENKVFRFKEDTNSPQILDL